MNWILWARTLQPVSRGFSSSLLFCVCPRMELNDTRAAESEYTFAFVCQTRGALCAVSLVDAE